MPQSGQSTVGRPRYQVANLLQRIAGPTHGPAGTTQTRHRQNSHGGADTALPLAMSPYLIISQTFTGMPELMPQMMPAVPVMVHWHSSEAGSDSTAWGRNGGTAGGNAGHQG